MAKTQTLIVKIANPSEKISKDQIKEAIEYHLAGVMTPEVKFSEVKVATATPAAIRKLWEGWNEGEHPNG
jgi:hypothetical protein